jgi:hypothetical protein
MARLKIAYIGGGSTRGAGTRPVSSPRVRISRAPKSS